MGERLQIAGAVSANHIASKEDDNTILTAEQFQGHKVNYIVLPSVDGSVALSGVAVLLLAKDRTDLLVLVESLS